jgi:hypothetical protein
LNYKELNLSIPEKNKKKVSPLRGLINELLPHHGLPPAVMNSQAPSEPRVPNETSG